MFTQYLKEGRRYDFSGPVEKIEKLNTGVYKCYTDPYDKLYLSETNIVADDLIAMKDSPSETITNNIDHFLKPEVKAAFKRYNMIYKRGILLHGLPGTGKTSIINLVIKSALEHDMIVLLNPVPYNASSAVNIIRQIENNNRAVLVIWEDLDSWLKNNENSILDILDGTDQIENIFYIATTNYIDKIPSRIKNRPSRFAEVIEVGLPNAELRRYYLSKKVHKEDKININTWVEKTEGFTLDHIKDLLISVLVLGISLDNAINKLLQMQKEDKTEAKMEEVEDAQYDSFNRPRQL